MFLIFSPFIFIFLFSSVFSNSCTIFAKNEPNYTQPNISNLNYKGSQAFPYNSLLEAILGIKYCDLNNSEINIYLLSDFYTISSYEINIMREKNSALFYADEYHIFYLFKDLQPNIRSLFISYYMKEGKAQISIKDQNISFQIDRSVTFKNINFTGIDINLDFNSDLHQDCFFDKIECCLLCSCFKQVQFLNISSFNQHGLFILDAGTIYLYEVTFFFFESYQLTKNPTYTALFTSRNSGSSMHIYDNYFSELFFMNGIILIKEFNDSNMVNSTFKNIASRKNMNAPCLKLISLEKISNFNFKNIIFMNSNVMTLFTFNYSNVHIINMTFVQSIFENTTIFLILDNCRTFFTNVLLKNLNFSILLQANNNNKLIIQNSFVHNVSLKSKYFIVAYNFNLIYFENFHIKEIKDAFYLIYLFRKNNLHFVRGNWEQIYLMNYILPSYIIEGALFLNYLNNLSLTNSIFQKIFTASLNYILLRSDNIIILRKLVIFKFSSINNGVFICTNESNILISQKNIFIDGITEKSGYFDISYSEISLKDCQFLNGTTGAYAIIHLLHTFLYAKNVTTSNISFNSYNIIKPLFLLMTSSIFLTESLISSIDNSGISFIYTERQSFISVLRLKISKCVFNLIYGHDENIFHIKEIDIIDFNILKIMLFPLYTNYNKLFISNLFLDHTGLYIPNLGNLYFYISNSTFFTNQNEAINILFSVGQNSLITIKQCSFYNFSSFIELIQNNSIIIIFSKFYCKKNQLYSIFSANQHNILILKDSLIYGRSSTNLLSKGLIIINRFNKLKLVKTHINFKFITMEDGKELHYFNFFDISMWNILFVSHCEFSIRQSSCLLNSIFQNLLVFQNIFFDIQLQVAKSVAIINFSRFFLKNSSIFNNTSNFIDGRDSWIKFEKINIEKYERKLIMCKVCSIILDNSKSSGENVKSSLFIELIASNFYFKKSALSFINVQETESLLKIHNCKIFIKKCTFHNIKLQNIRASFMDLNHFDNIVFFKKCTFAMNQGLASLIHLNGSRNDRIYFFSNILKLQLLYGVLIKINNSTANIKFYKNHLAIFDLVHFRSSKISPNVLIFITDSYESISFFNNTFERIVYNNLIFMEKYTDIENLNFMIGFSDSKNVKIQTEYIEAYFIDEQLQTKNKSCILHKIQLGKKYSNCLCAIHLFDGLDMPYYDINIIFQEIFEIEQTKQGNVNEFTFEFLNVAGKFCLSGAFEMLKLYSEFEVSKLQIIFHKKQILQPLLLIIDFQILCSQYHYIDINGNCRFCPMNYFPLFKFGDTLFRKNSLNSKSNCQLCDKDNPFYCFGEGKISPKPNFWQSGTDSSIFLRCPYDSSCRGDDRLFLSDNFVYKELNTLGFCIKNSKGILCSDCKENYGRWFEEECESCFSVGYSIFLFFQVLIKFIICSRVLYFSIKFFLVSDDYNQVLGKESKIVLHYESFNIFIQLMNSLVLGAGAVKFEIFKFLLRLTVLFSSNMDFAIPYECFFQNEEIKTQNLFLKLLFILTALICTFLLLSLYMRQYIRSKIKIFGKTQVFKQGLIIILSKCLNLFSYNLIEFCTKSFYYVEIRNEKTQQYFTIFLYGLKYEVIKDYFSFHIREFIILFSVIAIMSVIIILEVLSKKKLVYFKIFKFIFPLFLTIILNYLKLVKLSNYRSLNNLLNLTCFLILIYLLLMIILKPKNKIDENFYKYKQNHVKFYLSFLLFIIIYNISILLEDLQKIFDAIYSIFFFFIVFSEILMMKNIDKYFFQFFIKKKNKIKIKIRRKNMKNIFKHNKMIEKSNTKDQLLLDHRIFIFSKKFSFKRNFNKFQERIASLSFLRKFFFLTRLVSKDSLMEFSSMINNPKSFLRHLFILNYVQMQENMECFFEIQKSLFIEFLVKREGDYIDIFYWLDFDKNSVSMCDKILIIAQFTESKQIKTKIHKRKDRDSRNLSRLVRFSYSYKQIYIVLRYETENRKRKFFCFNIQKNPK